MCHSATLRGRKFDPAVVFPLKLFLVGDEEVQVTNIIQDQGIVEVAFELHHLCWEDLGVTDFELQGRLKQALGKFSFARGGWPKNDEQGISKAICLEHAQPCTDLRYFWKWLVDSRVAANAFDDGIDLTLLLLRLSPGFASIQVALARLHTIPGEEQVSFIH